MEIKAARSSKVSFVFAYRRGSLVFAVPSSTPPLPARPNRPQPVVAAETRSSYEYSSPILLEVLFEAPLPLFADRPPPSPKQLSPVCEVMGAQPFSNSKSDPYPIPTRLFVPKTGAQW